MRPPILRIVLVFLVGFAGWAMFGSMAAQPTDPILLIIDTDLGPDSDDAGALAVAHALTSLGEAELLAVMCSTKSLWCPPAADAINTYYGRADIPIGTVKGEGPIGTNEEWPGEAFNGYLAGHFENDLGHAEYAEDAVALYRRVLAGAPDSSLVIAVIGTQTNLEDLLTSPSDAIDGRTGADLVAAKVRHLSVMGGHYPSGSEPNFTVDAAAARHVAEHWPTPIMYSGFELGLEVLTGPRLYTETPPENPVRAAYHLWDLMFARRFTPDFDPESGIWPHSSFDQTAVLYAVRGLRDYWTAERRGVNTVREDGSNFWMSPAEAASADAPRPMGRHGYLTEKMPREELARIIEDLMVRPPSD